MKWVKDSIITVKREKSDKKERRYTTASQEAWSLQERALRYQHDLVELAVLWGIT